MPPEIKELVQLIGAPAVMVLLLMLRDWFNGRSTAKQDNAITDFAVENAAERKELQQSVNHLSAELTNLRVERGRDEGRLIEIKEAMERERTEWKAERLATDSTIREMQTNILDLQKNQRDNQAKIRELEAQIETLNGRIADKDGEISTHLATIAQLQTEIIRLTGQNTELSKQVDEHSARVENLSQLVKLGNDADFVPTTIDNTQALPDMRSVDDTFTPIPLAGTETNVNEPPLGKSA